MAITVTPVVGIPFPRETTKAALKGYRERAATLITTLEKLKALGEVTDEDLEPTQADREYAHTTLMTETIKPMDVTPASIQHVDAILSEYDRELLGVHTRLRAYVTNKLIEESAHFDGRIRLKALELLGKLTEVGAFTERVEQVRKEMSPEEIEDELGKYIEKYMESKTVATYPAATSDAAPTARKPAVLDVDMDEFEDTGP